MDISVGIADISIDAVGLLDGPTEPVDVRSHLGASAKDVGHASLGQGHLAPHPVVRPP